MALSEQMSFYQWRKIVDYTTKILSKSILSLTRQQSELKTVFTVDLQLNFTLVSLSITNFHSLDSS